MNLKKKLKFYLVVGLSISLNLMTFSYVTLWAMDGGEEHIHPHTTPLLASATVPGASLSSTGNDGEEGGVSGDLTEAEENLNTPLIPPAQQRQFTYHTGDPSQPSVVRGSINDGGDGDNKSLIVEGLEHEALGEEAVSPATEQFPHVRAFLNAFELKESDLLTFDLETPLVRGNINLPLVAEETLLDPLKRQRIFSSLESVLEVESSWSKSTLRLSTLENLARKLLAYLTLRRGATLKKSPEEHPCCDNVWVQGENVPITQESSLQRVFVVGETLRGLTTSFGTEKELAISFFLGTDLWEFFSSGNFQFSTMIGLLRGSDEHAINHMLSLTQNPAGYFLWSALLATPFLWGGYRGWQGCRASKMTADDITALLQDIDQYPNTLWKNSLNWWVPFYPLANKMHALSKHLKWNQATLSLKDTQEIFTWVRRFARERKGHTQREALDMMAEIVYGLHRRNAQQIYQGDENREDAKRSIAFRKAMQAEGLSILQEMANIKERWRTRPDWLTGVGRTYNAIHTRRLLWEIGQDSWGWLAFFPLWLLEMGLTGLTSKALIESLNEYFNCPNEFINLHHGDIGPISDTLECFNTYVDIFNTIPGQPARNITDLIPKVRFPRQYKLNLSGKGITAPVLTDILNGFADFTDAENKKIELMEIDLSNNMGGKDGDEAIYNLSRAIGRHTSLRSLNFGENLLENPPFQTAQSTIYMAECLRNLTKLAFLDLSGNNIAQKDDIDDQGTMALGQSLKNLLSLRTINLSGNLIGGNINPRGTQAIAEGIGYLSSLTSLNLGGNHIGYYDSNLMSVMGTIALGEGIGHLDNLESLNMGSNHIGHSDYSNPNGTVYLSMGIGKLRRLQVLWLHGSNYIGSGDYSNPEGTIAFGENIGNLLQLKELCLADNWIGYYDNINSSGTRSISKGLSQLVNLEQFTLLSAPPFKWTQSSPYPMPNVTFALINEGLKNTKIKLLFLIDENSVNSFFDQIPITTTLINMVNRFPVPSISTAMAVTKRLKQFANITDLNLGGNLLGLTPDSLAILGEFLSYFQKLKTLNLRGNALGFFDIINSQGTIALGKGIGQLSSLETLNLRTNNIGLRDDHDDRGTIALGEGVGQLSNLKCLNLDANDLFERKTNTAGVITFATNIGKLTNLENLFLNQNEIGVTTNLTEGIIVLGKSIGQLSNLKCLDLGINNIGECDTTKTGACDYIDERGTIAIGEGIKKLSQLTSLDLGINYLGYNDTYDVGATAIMEAIGSLEELLYLNLQSWPNFGFGSPNATRALAKSLLSTKKLNILNLRFNRIGSLGPEEPLAILQALTTSHSQNLTLNVQGMTNITWVDAAQVLAAIKGQQVREGCDQQKCFDRSAVQSVSSEKLSFESNSLPSDSSWDQFSAGQRRTLSTSFGRENGQAIYKGLALEVSEEDEGEVKPNLQGQENPSRSLAEEQAPDLQSQQKAETLDLLETLSFEEEPTSFFLTRWGRGVGRFISSSWQSTKETTWSYWDSTWDWITGKVTRYATHVVTDNESYFPNGNNPKVRDWPSKSTYSNRTSLHGGGIPALPPGAHFAALP